MSQPRTSRRSLLTCLSFSGRARSLRTGRAICATLLALGLGVEAMAAVAAPAASPARLPDAPLPHTGAQKSTKLRDIPRNILRDQAAIWTSPARLRPRDLEWLGPLTLATGAAIATDHRAMSEVVSHDRSLNNASLNTSNVLIGGFIAAPVALFGAGHFRQDAHAREAGLLSGEALVDGIVVEQGMKLMFWRERPAVDSARGRFFQSSVGVDSSFPSSHSVLAWAVASELAGEYPSRWKQFLLYTAATGVSITRVMGQEHFPSDVMVGSAAGWLVGHYVYRHHHHAQVE